MLEGLKRIVLGCNPVCYIFLHFVSGFVVVVSFLGVHYRLATNKPENNMIAPEKTANQAAEIIQGRFTFNDDDNVVGCKSMYFSDLLGSDWASGRNFDSSSNPADFYRAVKEAATRKFGKLPF